MKGIRQFCHFINKYKELKTRKSSLHFLRKFNEYARAIKVCTILAICQFVQGTLSSPVSRYSLFGRSIMLWYQSGTNQRVAAAAAAATAEASTVEVLMHCMCLEEGKKEGGKRRETAMYWRQQHIYT